MIRAGLALEKLLNQSSYLHPISHLQRLVMVRAMHYKILLKSYCWRLPAGLMHLALISGEGGNGQDASAPLPLPGNGGNGQDASALPPLPTALGIAKAPALETHRTRLP